MASEKAFEELPEGGMITRGRAARRKYNTGDWRSKRPECDEEKCTNCLICWIYCPDNSIIVKEGKRVGFQAHALQGLWHLRQPVPGKVHHHEGGGSVNGRS